MPGKKKLFHLRIPVAMAESMQPTGCRQSPDTEIAWRLGAAIEVARQLRSEGLLPINKENRSKTEDSKTEEVHVLLSEEDSLFLAEVSRSEGGSKGELARQLLLAVEDVLAESSCVFTHEGLVRALMRRFAPVLFEI